MQEAPSSVRLHIALFGRTNVGKSSFLNQVAGQDVAITSAQPGTTTDVVRKPMELLPLGPVVFLDTAGLNDESELGALRLDKTRRVFDQADVVLLISEPNRIGTFEETVLSECACREIPVVAVVNKTDVDKPGPDFLARLSGKTQALLQTCSVRKDQRERTLRDLKSALLRVCPGDFLRSPPLVGDLVRPGGLAALIVPIDLQAPKGRLILPQVQTIRDALDNDAATLVVKEREFSALLRRIGIEPDLVVCDSQVVLKMVADTPPGVPCTTFSILFARLKGDLQKFAAGAGHIDRLESGDRVLIAESCSHHPLEDDIGRVKIPRWLRQYTGAELSFDITAGRDFPDSLGEYSLVVQCGGCMNNRREMLSRIARAEAAGVPITNYGLCISKTQGVLERVLSPFPAALDALQRPPATPGRRGKPGKDTRREIKRDHDFFSAD